MDNRPIGREKHVTGEGKSVHRRGAGLGTGPVGSPSGYAGRGSGSAGGPQRSGGTPTRGGRSPLMLVVVLIFLLLGGGGAGLSGLLGGNSASASFPSSFTNPSQHSASSLGSGAGMSTNLQSLLGGFGNVSSGWTGEQNTGRLDTSVATGSRAKRTVLRGNGRDTVTIMVYMCGTDLESRNGMATADLQEMASAKLSDQVNILVYTGGCRQWKNNIVSSSVNQVYKVEPNGLRLLAEDGNALMTNPATLSGFIQYCAKNFPADRNELIFWDHGGGSLSGYGYDEKNPSSGSMPLKGINEALRSAGVTFDFIGFDACLMATLENALMLTDYADYLIASEETEPGVGWYYTDWLTKLSQNTSMPTTEIGKNIIDDFVSVCNQKCRGQKTTLSLVDLAELEHTVPDRLNAFATDTSALVQRDFKAVSTARGNAREFAASNKIDQVDLVHLAYRLDTTDSRALARALLGAVKYNKTSASITDAYGLSVYFPYQRASKVKAAVAAYDAIGMDSDYARCIQQFASLEAGGQAVAGGASSPLNALLGGGSGSGAVSSDMISQVLTSLLSGGAYGRSLDMTEAAGYLSENRFDADALVWTGDEPQITLTEEQWSLVHDLELNVFLDDGEGYIDLGLDNQFSFTDDGALAGEFDGTWLAIDAQPVAYYHTGTVTDGDSYTITGRVPVLLNGHRAELLLVFDNDHPYGYIAGARSIYTEDETETVAKGITALQEGDAIDFLCDYYAYDGTYEDSYLMGDPWTYHADAEISNVTIDASAAQATYCFTDIYGQQYWTPPLR
jgi:hypothetical protein